MASSAAGLDRYDWRPDVSFSPACGGYSQKTEDVGAASQEQLASQASDEETDVSQCVKDAGYDPDRMFFLYTNTCGQKFAERVKDSSRATGVWAVQLDIGLLKGMEINLLECFYGPFQPDNRQFFRCPRLLCPRTGKVYDLDSNRPMTLKIRQFALRCSQGVEGVVGTV